MNISEIPIKFKVWKDGKRYDVRAIVWHNGQIANIQVFSEDLEGEWLNIWDNIDIFINDYDVDGKEIYINDVVEMYSNNGYLLFGVIIPKKDKTLGYDIKITHGYNIKVPHPYLSFAFDIVSFKEIDRNNIKIIGNVNEENFQENMDQYINAKLENVKNEENEFCNEIIENIEKEKESN